MNEAEREVARAILISGISLERLIDDFGDWTFAVTTSTQKNEEEFFAQKFLELANLEHGLCSHERPDFLLDGRGEQIGLEVTRIFRPHMTDGLPRQAHESLRRQVIARAKAHYDASLLPPVHLWVHFNSQYPFSKEQVARLAAILSAWAQKNVPDAGGRFEEEHDWFNRAHFPE